MVQRTSTTRGRSVVHVEAPRADELPAGTPGPARPVATRDGSGRFVPGAGTSDLARKGGKAAHESRQLAALLGLWEVPDDHPYAPYARLAREWRDAQIERLSATVGGGEVGPAPASIISSAALQLAASRWLSDKGAQDSDSKLLLEASRLANDSRQGLLAAHELCAREAQARPKESNLTRLLREVAGEKKP